MDKKSRILVTLFSLAVALSVAVVFYRYIVLEDISYATEEAIFQESLLEE